MTARAGRGRRAGGADTRGEILDAARASLAEAGFGGTSIRKVAAVAGVDPALVHHYFGTKDGLFRAALEIPIAPAVLLEEVFADGVELAPERLVRMFLKVWDDPHTGAAMASFLRTAVSTEESAAMARQFFRGVVLKAAADQLAISYHQSFGLPVRIARPCNTVGPGSRRGPSFRPSSPS